MILYFFKRQKCFLNDVLHEMCHYAICSVIAFIASHVHFNPYDTVWGISSDTILMIHFKYIFNHCMIFPYGSNVTRKVGLNPEHTFTDVA